MTARRSPVGQAIKEAEIRFHRLSYADPNGRLFHWRDGLYRGIRPAYAGIVERLIASGVLRSLVERGLVVDTEPTALELPGFVRVLRHRLLPFVTYPQEWTPAMLRDAALAVLQLEQELWRIGLTLRDMHPWNVLFDGAEPRFVDLCSMSDERDAAAGPSQWAGLASFCRYFLAPLLVASAGLDRWSRLCFNDYRGTDGWELRRIQHAPDASSAFLWCVALELEQPPPGPPSRWERVKSAVQPWRPAEPHWRSLTRQELVQRLQNGLNALPVEPAKGRWSSYYGQGTLAEVAGTREGDSAKIRNFLEALELANPGSVIDVGANTGFFAGLATARGCEVVAIDSEASCVEALYLGAKRDKRRLVTAVVDARNPTPAQGPVCEELPSSLERLQCEFVSFLGLSHHLAHAQAMTFEQMIDTCERWARRWILFEYVDPSDAHINTWGLENKAWYSLEALRRIAEPRFDVIRVMDSYPASRKLLLLERRR